MSDIIMVCHYCAAASDFFSSLFPSSSVCAQQTLHFKFLVDTDRQGHELSWSQSLGLISESLHCVSLPQMSINNLFVDICDHFISHTHSIESSASQLCSLGIVTALIDLSAEQMCQDSHTVRHYVWVWVNSYKCHAVNHPRTSIVIFMTVKGYTVTVTAPFV